MGREVKRSSADLARRKEREAKSARMKAVSSDRRPDWLPDGWIVEVGVDDGGAEVECYLDPFTGSRFYSKAEVLRFLELEKLNSQAPSEKGHLALSAKDDVLAQIEHSPEGLPQGWIKETKFRKSKGGKIIRDPYYTDPVNGYVFHSLKDATHYVETGELSKHVIGSRKTSVCEVYSIEKESLPPIPLKELESVGSAARQCLCTEETPPEGDVMMNVEDSHEMKRKNGNPPKKNNSSPSVQSKERKKESGELLESTLFTEKSSEKPVNITGKPLENNEEENKALILELTEAAEKPVAVIKAITPISQGRKQQKRKRETISLPRRSSKRLAGLQPAPTADLVINRPPHDPQNGAECNAINRESPRRSSKRLAGLQPAPTADLVINRSPHDPQNGAECNAINRELPLEELHTVDNADESSSKKMAVTRNTSEEMPSSPRKHVVIANSSEERPPSPEKHVVVMENTFEGRPLSPRKHMVMANTSEERLPSPEKHVVVMENTFEGRPSAPRKHVLEMENSFEGRPSSPEKHVVVMVNTSEERSSSPGKHTVVMENTSEERPSSPGKHVVVMEYTSEERPLSPGKHAVVMENASEKRLLYTSKQTAATGNTFGDESPSELTLPFGDCWPDPCIEFAVKTLLGEIPVLSEGVAIEEYVQKHLGSSRNEESSAGAIASDNRGLERAKQIVPSQQPADSAQHLLARGEGKPYPLGNGLPWDGKASSSKLNP